jgi:ectoine hydroxylase-related dioxygenase (phytanoyl-CoA dioxygenase family)
MNTSISETRDVMAITELLQGQGYAVLRNIADTQTISALASRVAADFDQAAFCQGPFYGTRTKRRSRLLSRYQESWPLVLDKTILDIAQAVLGPQCDYVQLNLTQAIAIDPGEGLQPPHRDRDMWNGGKMAAERGWELLINVMWPMTAFTPENGATRVWAGSHRQDDVLLPEQDADMPSLNPGDALVFLGSTLHGGGRNTTMASRQGILISYTLGWLTPFESNFLAYPPDVARQFPKSLQELLGYRIHRPNLNNVDGLSPAYLLTPEQPRPSAPQDEMNPESMALLHWYQEEFNRSDASIAA